MKKNVRIACKCAVMLVLLVVMYYFSRQNGVDSDIISQKCTAIFINAFGRIGLGHPAQKFLYYIDIRKIAHVVIFFVVCVVSYVIFDFDSKKKRIGTVIAIGLVLAFADEFHQSFVDGRTSTLTDVLIDLLGLVFGLCFVLLIEGIAGKIREKKNEKN